MLTKLCDRPHIRQVNFNTARFVVGTVRGLDVDGRHLERGEEVPRGALSETALRLEYDLPTRHIETVDYAFTDPDLRIECLKRGVVLDVTTPQVAPPAQEEAAREVPQCVIVAPDLDVLPYGDLVELCKENGISHVGNTKQLRARLRALGN